MTRRRNISESTPVGQIARFYPAAADVFESMDIEFGCKGARPLRDASTAAGYAPEEVLQAVEELTAGTAPVEEGTVAELLHLIVTTHHRVAEQYFRDVLQELQGVPEEPEVPRMRNLLLAAKGSLSRHMLREERELFPRIEELEQHPHRVRLGSLSRPLLMEFVEHDTIHEWLLKVRELALRMRGRGVNGPLLDKIEELDQATHRHLHAENNVLIPRVIELEHKLKARRQGSTPPQPETTNV